MEFDTEDQVLFWYKFSRENKNNQDNPKNEDDRKKDDQPKMQMPLKNEAS